MKTWHVLPFLLLAAACTKPSNPAIQSWLDRLDARDAVTLHTGISLALPTTSKSVSAAKRDYLAIEKHTKLFGTPLEEQLTSTWTAFTFHAEQDGIEGFVFLYRDTQRPDHIWSGRFVPADWFDKQKKNGPNHAMERSR